MNLIDDQGTNSNENSLSNDFNLNLDLNNEMKSNSSLSSSINEFSSDDSNLDEKHFAFTKRNSFEQRKNKSILKKNFNSSSSIYLKIREKNRSKSVENLSSRKTNRNSLRNSSKIQINLSSISIQCFFNSKSDFEIYFHRNQNQTKSKLKFNQKQNRVSWAENQQEFHLNHSQCEETNHSLSSIDLNSFSSDETYYSIENNSLSNSNELNISTIYQRSLKSKFCSKLNENQYQEKLNSYEHLLKTMKKTDDKLLLLSNSMNLFNDQSIKKNPIHFQINETNENIHSKFYSTLVKNRSNSTLINGISSLSPWVFQFCLMILIIFNLIFFYYFHDLSQLWNDFIN